MPQRSVISFLKRYLFVAFTAYFLVTVVIFSGLNYLRKGSVYKEEMENLRNDIVLERDKLLFASVVGSQTMITDKLNAIAGRHRRFSICSNLLDEGCEAGEMKVGIDPDSHFFVAATPRHGLLAAAILSRVNLVLFLAYMMTTLSVKWILERALRRQVLQPLAALADFLSNFRKRREGGFHMPDQNGIIEWTMIDAAIQNIIVQIQHLEEEAARKTAEDVASQVAHDIRSPLSALNLAILTCDEISPERKDLIERACRRIQDIANDLLDRSRAECASGNSEDLSGIVESVILEKKFILGKSRSLHIDSDLDAGKKAICGMEAKSLKRILSNLIDNSVEALPTEGDGHIRVAVRTLNQEAHITISDNGRGIHTDLLPKLGVSRISAGKNAGNGFGLLHACTTLRANGGNLKISSQPGKGTTVDVVVALER